MYFKVVFSAKGCVDFKQNFAIPESFRCFQNNCEIAIF